MGMRQEVAVYLLHFVAIVVAVKTAIIYLVEYMNGYRLRMPVIVVMRPICAGLAMLVRATA